MKKVDEPNVEEAWQCPRCLHNHCGDCVDAQQVDFSIRDAPDGYNQLDVEWEGSLVCPWCYNQLIDKLTHTTDKTEVK